MTAATRKPRSLERRAALREYGGASRMFRPSGGWDPSICFHGLPIPDAAPAGISEDDYRKAFEVGRCQADEWVTRERPAEPEMFYSVAYSTVVDAGARYQPGPAGFPTYAYRCVWQRLYHEARRQRGLSAKPVVSLDALAETEAGQELADPSPSPEEQAIASETAAEVRDALSVLDPQERRVIELRFTSELSHTAAARTMGVSAGRVRELEASALLKLRGVLAG